MNYNASQVSWVSSFHSSETCYSLKFSTTNIPPFRVHNAHVFPLRKNANLSVHILLLYYTSHPPNQYIAGIQYGYCLKIQSITWDLYQSKNDFSICIPSIISVSQLTLCIFVLFLSRRYYGNCYSKSVNLINYKFVRN